MPDDMRTTGGPSASNTSVRSRLVGQQMEDEVDGFLPVRNGGYIPGGRLPPASNRRPQRNDRSKSESYIFSQETDFDSDTETQDPTWISDNFSETSPLFGSELGRAGASTTMAKPDKPPADNYKFCWLVFYLLGMTTLLPWNFFISVNDYWKFKFRDTSGNPNTTNSTTELQNQFTSYLAIASNIPNATFVILNVFFGRSFRLNVRIIGALACMSTLFIGVILMARIDSDDWQEWFLFSTLSIVVFLNICTAIFQGGIIGVAGKFPPNYIGGMMSGQALGGIFPSLVNILVIAVQVKGADIGFYCFIVAFIFVLISLAMYAAVQTRPFFRYYAGTSAENSVEDSSAAAASNTVTASTYKEIFITSWRYQVSVFLNFMTTLSVFPSIIVLIKSQYSSDPDNVYANSYFIPVTCFLLFNVGDYVGRTLASFIKQPGASKMGQTSVLITTILRIGFIPLFMYCNAAPDKRDIPVLFDKDADYYALMTVFSISNGYIGNICMMMGPKTVQNENQQEIVASMLVSILVLGIGIGSALSYPLVSVLA